MKSETGMGHLTLAIIVLVIILIAGFGIHFTKQKVTDNIIETVKTDMLLIQGKLKIVNESVKVNSEENSLKGTKVADLKEDEQVKTLLEANILGEKAEEYYRLGRQELDEMGLTTVQLQENQYYFVHYDTKDVVTNLDIKDQEGNIYHHLSELLEAEENQENANQEENAVTTENTETSENTENTNSEEKEESQE